MGICCSSFLNANHEGEPAFMNEDNIVAGNKKTNDAENYENDDDQQHRDVVPLLQTEDLKNAEILGYTEEWIQEGQKLICRRKYQCREDIAREMALSVNDSQKK